MKSRDFNIEVKSKFTEIIKRKVGKMEVEIGIFPSEVPEVKIEDVKADENGIKKIVFIPKHFESPIGNPKLGYDDENIAIYIDPEGKYIREIIIKKKDVHNVEISIMTYEKEIEKEIENISDENLEELKFLDYQDRQLSLAKDLVGEVL